MPETTVALPLARSHELARMRLTDLQGLYLQYYGDGKHVSALMLSGTDIACPGGRIRLIPWDRDRYITAILDHEQPRP